MWHGLVLKTDTMVERLTLGFVNVCSAHPLVSMGFLALMLALVCTLWVQLLELRRTAAQSLDPRPIRLMR